MYFSPVTASMQNVEILSKTNLNEAKREQKRSKNGKASKDKVKIWENL
jgi:hypothetical protein